MELHGPGQPGASLKQAVKEVEAESVAWLVGHHWGLDTASYTLPYLAHWSRGNEQILVDTAHRAVTTTRQVIQELDEHASATPRSAGTPGEWPDLTAFPPADQCVHPTRSSTNIRRSV
jgi:hypothetical protein